MFESRPMNAARRLQVILLVLAAAAGCKPDGKASATANTAEATGKLKLVCTTAQVGDILLNIGAERVAVETLMGPGVDPHLYRATLGDTKKLKGADAIFYSGLHLEGRLADVLESMARNKS